MDRIRLILLVTFVMLSTLLYSQRINKDSLIIRPLNNISISWGDASIVSLTYERLFRINSNFILAGKLGIGYNEEFQLCFFGPCATPPKNYITIPHYVSANFGKKKQFLEIGLGGTLLIGNTNQHYWMYPIIGFRFQPLKSRRLNFRLFGSIPFSGFASEDILFIPIGLSTGLVF